MLKSMNSICVFCGSSTGYNGLYETEARRLGSAIAARGLRLVYGGSDAGLMGILARAVLEGGGGAAGIIPRAIHEKVPPLDGVETVVVEDMHSRKMRMHELSDGFIALPGGIGTFEEVLEAFTWSQLGFHDKPVALLNTAGYYDPLIEQFRRSVSEGFLKESHRNTLLVDTDPELLLERMENYKPLHEDKWIGREKS
jgi:uncharacterized protein (TIGR00730 family)